MIERKIVLILCCLALFQLVRTQSLEVITEEAIVNNRECQALQREYEAAVETAIHQSQYPDPVLGLGFAALPVQTRLGAQWLKVGVTQMVPWKGSLPARENYQKTLATINLEKMAHHQLQLTFQVKNNWYELYELEKTADVLRRQLIFLASLERLALSKVEVGKGSTADVLLVQLRRQNLDNKLALLSKKMESPRLLINQLRNQALDTPINLVDSLERAIPLYQKDTLASWIGQKHPMLKIFALQQKAAREAQEINRLSGKPKIGVGLDYGLVAQRTDAEPKGNGRDILMPRVSVQIPLHRKKYEAKDREERLKIAALDLRSADRASQFLAAIETAYSELAQVDLQLKFYDQQIETLRATITLLQNEYISSKRNLEEILRLEQELLNYDLLRLKAVVDSHRALSKMERFIP